MGRRSASEIAQLCCLPPRDVGRALGRLTAWGVVINENGGFDLQSVDAAPSAGTSRHDETWSLRRITSEDVLRRIVGEFRNGLDYDEVQSTRSAHCSTRTSPQCGAHWSMPGC